MPLFTKGFDDARALTLHFIKHGALLGAADENAYLVMADLFLGAPLAVGTAECTRQSDNDRLRFCEAAQRFGVLRTDNVIRTFYQFDPPPRDAAWFAKRCAG